MQQIVRGALTGIEAEQEAGLKGRVEKKVFGSFIYRKQLVDCSKLVEVKVYALHVTGTLPTWKEQAERTVQWMRPEDAALLVDEPGLAALLGKLSAREAGKTSGADG